MEYKLVSPLLTRHVEPWADYMGQNNVFDKMPPAREAVMIRKAVEFGWFAGDAPNVDEMLPVDTVKLGTTIIRTFNEVMGFNRPNLPAASPDTPKE